MKKLITIIGLVMASGVFVLSSCSKPDDNNGEPGGYDPIPTPEFEALIDGNDFKAIQKLAFIDHNNSFVIWGLDNQGSAISLFINNFQGEKTYAINLADQNGAIYTPDTINVYNTYSTFNENSVGNVNITDWDATDSIINGTFSFVAEHSFNDDIATITEGVISNIQVAFKPDDSNHFSVKIDGVNWSSGSNVLGGVSYDYIFIKAAYPFDQTSFDVTLPSNITGGIYNFNMPGYSISIEKVQEIIEANGV